MWLQCDFTLKPRKPSFSALCLLFGSQQPVNTVKAVSSALLNAPEPICPAQLLNQAAQSAQSLNEDELWSCCQLAAPSNEMCCTLRRANIILFPFHSCDFPPKKAVFPSCLSAQQKGEERQRQEATVDRKQEHTYFVGGNCF